MTSQYKKRKQKESAGVSEVQETPLVVEETAPVYTQTGYDIFSPDGGKNYEVAELSYNPTTGEAKVINTFKISRLVALSYANQKVALQTLKKGK